MTIDIKPADATLGAAVRGIDLAALDDDGFRDIEAAWHDYAVLIFPDQNLSADDHLTFSRRFGRLEQGIRRRVDTGFIRISNVRDDGTVAPRTSLQARFLVGNTHWHSDSSYKRVAAKASILAAHTVPDDGGETEWADMRAGYDALDDDRKAWLDDKIAVHDYAFSHAPFGGLEILTPAELALLPPVEHPLVRIHPATGRKNLYVGRHASHIVGEDVVQSRQVLRRLTDHCGRPPHTVMHKWRVGDIVIWDNRRVLHRGRPWPADQPRTMIRTTVAGDGEPNEWALDAA